MTLADRLAAMEQRVQAATEGPWSDGDGGYGLWLKRAPGREGAYVTPRSVPEPDR